MDPYDDVFVSVAPERVIVSGERHVQDLGGIPVASLRGIAAYDYETRALRENSSDFCRRIDAKRTRKFQVYVMFRKRVIGWRFDIQKRIKDVMVVVAGTHKDGLDSQIKRNT